MTSVPEKDHQSYLLRLATDAMRERGFEPEFPAAALAELDRIAAEPPSPGPGVRDARDLLWSSIDNDDSRDLDQLTAAEALDGGRIRILVAIADVSGSVAPGSAIDRHARVNTTSVYTPPRVFPMLPERLSTDLTSLNAGEDRAAFVVEAEVSPDGTVGAEDVYRALVRNRAQLAYPAVGAWLKGSGPRPDRIDAVRGLEGNLRRQDRAAQAIEDHRREQGALELAPIQVKAVLRNGAVDSLRPEPHSRARELIENFMVLANGVVARFLADRGFPVLRRVVRSPERWDRIAGIAEELGTRLPDEPDAKALHDFLTRRRRADPLRFPDLSLSIVKLLGRGEYVATPPGQAAAGHFGLAVNDYTHSTAPNRRYPDLVTQRLVRAAIQGRPVPYPASELDAIAKHCTERENEAQRVERRLVKSAAALLLGDRLGHEFDGLVTGASAKGTWVRVFDPPVEGRVERGAEGLDVGDRVRVKLIHTDPEKGFIDFERVGHGPVGRRRG